MPAAKEAAQERMAFPRLTFEGSPLREQIPRMRRSGGGSPRRPRASHRIQGLAQEMALPKPAGEEAAQEMTFPRPLFENVAQHLTLCEYMPRMRRLGGGSPQRPHASHRIQGPVQEIALTVLAAEKAA